MMSTTNGSAPEVSTSSSDRDGRPVPCTEVPFDVTARLQIGATAIVDAATKALDRSHPAHYTEAGPEERRRRVESLFQVLIDSLHQRDLGAVQRYAETVARERFEGGFDVFEVQTAFNVLGEATWRHVVASVDPAGLAEASAWWRPCSELARTPSRVPMWPSPPSGTCPPWI